MSDPLKRVILPAAREDFDRVYKFLAAVNVRAVKGAMVSIRRDAEMLRRNPDIGCPVEDRVRYREWVVRLGAGGYVMRYRIDNERLVIVRIWHSREERT